MKRTAILLSIIFSILLSNCKSGKQEAKTTVAGAETIVTELNNESFKKLVYNYETDKQWKYEGDLPAVIDFYADWCPPCHQLSPLVEEVAREFHGKIIVYKVDTGRERDLTQALGITNLPTLLYIPAKGAPKVTLGYIPKETIVKTINEVLLTR
jgi:thioredoxin 1